MQQAVGSPGLSRLMQMGLAVENDSVTRQIKHLKLCFCWHIRFGGVDMKIEQPQCSLPCNSCRSCSPRALRGKILSKLSI